MKCTIQGCGGEYQARAITHTVRHRDEIVVIDHVPAEVCDLCGDVLLTPQTVRHIEDILKTPDRPSRSARIFEFA